MEEQQAEALTAQLEEVYRRFWQRSEELAPFREEEKKGLAGFLRGIFPTPQPTEPEHQRFLADVERITGELAAALEQLPPDPVRQELARRAVACFLASKPLEGRSPEEWFMTAAEGKCLPLLPFLAPQAVEEFYAGMAAVPRRYLFPRQLDVLKALEGLRA